MGAYKTLNNDCKWLWELIYYTLLKSTPEKIKSSSEYSNARKAWKIICLSLCKATSSALSWASNLTRQSFVEAYSFIF